MQERRNSIANALELRLSCTNPSIYLYSATIRSLHYSHFPSNPGLPSCRGTFELSLGPPWKISQQRRLVHMISTNKITLCTNFTLVGEGTTPKCPCYLAQHGSLMSTTHVQSGVPTCRALSPCYSERIPSWPPCGWGAAPRVSGPRRSQRGPAAPWQSAHHWPYSSQWTPRPCPGAPCAPLHGNLRTHQTQFRGL